MTFSLTSCFVFDKAPGVSIKIEKSILPEIDSIFLINVSQDSNVYQSRRGRKVTEDQSRYFLYSSIKESSKIKLQLTNSSVIISDSTFIINHSPKIFISKNDGVIGFSQIERNSFQIYSKMALVIFIILFVTKVPVATLINKPKSKLRFMLLFAGLNLLYVLICMILIGFLKEMFAIMLYPFYIIVLGADITFLIKQYPDSGKSRPIIAGVVSNLLFLTIGQFIITILAMSFL